MQTVWNINGMEFQFDLSEADTAERYESGIQRIGNMDLPNPKDSLTAYIRAYCRQFREFYNFMLGDGAGDQIFATVKDSISAYNAVYKEFLAFIQQQSESLSDEFRQMQRKYAPKGGKA